MSKSKLAIFQEDERKGKTYDKEPLIKAASFSGLLTAIIGVIADSQLEVPSYVWIIALVIVPIGASFLGRFFVWSPNSVSELVDEVTEEIHDTIREEGEDFE